MSKTLLVDANATVEAAPDATMSSRSHIDRLRRALDGFQPHTDRIEQWGQMLARSLTSDGRLLVVGNGGSAAHAEHLASELVGRYAADRRPFSAIALHVDGAALSAIVNDYGVEEMFARQVRAHARPGDVVVALSTSGQSPNVLAAARAANQIGATVLSLTGPSPNPLTVLSTDSIGVAAEVTATVQEVHQVAIHLLCSAFDRHVLALDG